MRKFKLEEVNKKHSSTWTSCNDDARSTIYRKEFITQFGGEFIKSGRYYEWKYISEPEDVYIPRRLLRFLDSNKNLVEIDHMSDFCKERKYSKAAMYEVLRGTRKQYKGYTALPVHKID